MAAVKEKTAKKSGKKAARFSEKKGINLIQNQEKNKHMLFTVLAAVVAVVLLEVLFKYGVLDLYSKLNDARAQYDDVHIQYISTQNQLKDYDDVLLEYRTYSMDWMENDTSGKYVSINRREILDLLESKVMKLGNVSDVSIKGNDVTIKMTGLDLRQISAMCTELEESPIVKSAVFTSGEKITKEDTNVTPETETDGETDVETDVETEETKDELSFNIRIRLQKPED